MGGCGKKPVLAIGGNTSNFLMHLGRHHLERYAELLEVQEKGKLNTTVVIYTVIFYNVPYRLKNFCTAQL